jgi:hypothetical protein
MGNGECGIVECGIVNGGWKIERTAERRRSAEDAERLIRLRGNVRFG